jgi:hypothetical protein
MHSSLTITPTFGGAYGRLVRFFKTMKQAKAITGQMAISHADTN